MIQKLKYRLRYWLRKIIRALGQCEKCHSKLNYTTTGRGICPNCGH